MWETQEILMYIFVIAVTKSGVKPWRYDEAISLQWDTRASELLWNCDGLEPHPTEIAAPKARNDKILEIEDWKLKSEGMDKSFVMLNSNLEPSKSA